MKKIHVLGIAVLMAASVSAQTMVSYEYKGKTLLYNLYDTDGSAEVIDDDSASGAIFRYGGDIIIPDTVLYADPDFPGIPPRAYTVKRIGNNAFSGIDTLRHVTLPSTLQTIMNNAFAFTPIDSIVIPPYVDTIYDRAFYNCDNLTKVYMERPVPAGVNYSAFNKTPATATLYVPNGSVYAYESKSWAKDHFSVAGKFLGKADVEKVTDTEVSIKWVPSEEAETYLVEIYLNDELFRKYLLNSEGKLIPQMAPAIHTMTLDTAICSTDYYIIELDGLQTSSNYSYTITGYDQYEYVVCQHKGLFHTAEKPAEQKTAHPFAAPSGVRKMLRDGRVLIERNGVWYDPSGQTESHHLQNRP